MQEKEWFVALEQGWTIMTVNRRLARYLTQKHAQRMQETGRLVWSTPDILPFSAWLERCWIEWLDGGASDGNLLNDDQERLIWEQIVTRSDAKGALLWTDSAAHDAQRAWNLLSAWLLELAEEEAVGDRDALAFCRWQEDFVTLCRRHGWIPRGRMAPIVAANLSGITLPRGVVLAGFDEVIPSYRLVLNNLQKLAVPVTQWRGERKEGEKRRFSFPDQESEIVAAARWARGMIEQGQAQTIGIVVPDLHAMRRPIIRIFSDIFYPGSPHHVPFPSQSLFNLSLGTPLSEIAMIRDAFQLLTLTWDGMDWQDGIAWLASPYWGGGETEWGKRALLDAELRRHRWQTLSLKDLIREGRGKTPELVKRLSALQTFLRESGLTKVSRQTPGEWAVWFETALKRVGWPGERPLDSLEFQTLEGWHKLLDRFSSLAVVVDKMAVSEALTQLHYLAGETIFQPLASEARVHILGALEAGGEQFDALWILGLSEQNWPTAPNPQAFLPIHFQRRYNLPHSSSLRELHYVNKVTQRLLCSADRVVVSHAVSDGDLLQRVSPLVSHIDGSDLKQFPVEPFPTLAESAMKVGGLVPRPVSSFPVMEGRGVISGGTSIIKSQALCPFSAFGLYRLLAVSLDEPTPGFDAAQRGDISHEALSLFWQQTSDAHALGNLSSAMLASQVVQVCQQSVQKQALRCGNVLPPAYLQLEVDRQTRLILEWLTMERDRSPPFVVVEREFPGLLSLEGVEIRFRIDRIDRLAGKDDQKARNWIVVDYKTGKSTVNNWFSDRPEEPQMLLYALSCRDRLGALVYGQLQLDKPRYVGVTHQEGVLEGVSLLPVKQAPDFPDWEALLDHWQTVIHRLAKQFQQGDARVDPLRNACQWCDLPLLCRVAEQNDTLARKSGMENEEESMS